MKSVIWFSFSIIQVFVEPPTFIWNKTFLKIVHIRKYLFEVLKYIRDNGHWNSVMHFVVEKKIFSRRKTQLNALHKVVNDGFSLKKKEKKQSSNSFLQVTNFGRFKSAFLLYFEHVKMKFFENLHLRKAIKIEPYER